MAPGPTAGLGRYNEHLVPESQLAQLKAAGCEKVFREKITGQLEYSLSCLSSGNNKKKQNGESNVYQSKETIPEIRANKRGLGTKVCLP
jgi:hypothetical protein